MNIDEQFKIAAEQVNNLPPQVAGAHMNEFYGLYKQATEGDVNMKPGEVDSDAADLADGPSCLSQAQWDSWNQFKGVPEAEAKRRYVARAAEIAGNDDAGAPTNAIATDAITNAPAGGPSSPTENTTTARQPGHGPGQATSGGLRGDITAGAPYGGEDLLKGQQ